MDVGGRVTVTVGLAGGEVAGVGEVAIGVVEIHEVMRIGGGDGINASTGVVTEAEELSGRPGDAVAADDEALVRGRDDRLHAGGGIDLVACAVWGGEDVVGAGEFARGGVVGAAGLEVVEVGAAEDEFAVGGGEGVVNAGVGGPSGGVVGD